MSPFAIAFLIVAVLGGFALLALLVVAGEDETP